MFKQFVFYIFDMLSPSFSVFNGRISHLSTNAAALNLNYLYPESDKLDIGNISAR